MRSILMISFFSIVCLCHSFSQIIHADTVDIATINDTTEYFFASGFYRTFPDTSNSYGFKLLGKNEYFLIDKECVLTLRNLDTAFKEFDSITNEFVLTLNFDSIGSEYLLEFSTKYQGQKIGLLLNNNFLSIETITAPISAGFISIAANLSELQLDELLPMIRREANSLKRRRGSTKRKGMTTNKPGSH